MKTAKRILLCMLAIAMLITCLSMNTAALSLGAAKAYYDADGAKLFDIYLWNSYEPGYGFMLSADLTLYEAADYTFAACYASIRGRNTTTGAIESYDGDEQLADYQNELDLWDFAAAYISSGDHCCDDVAKPANLEPFSAEGTAVVGYSGYGSYRYKFYGADADSRNIKFTPARVETHRAVWRNPSGE